MHHRSLNSEGVAPWTLTILGIIAGSAAVCGLIAGYLIWAGHLLP